MVVPDYDTIFDVLDIQMKGYLTIEQLQDFQNEVLFASLDRRQIEAAVNFVCGRNSQLKCTKEYFGGVVEEISRRVSLEESIYWDFKCLDVLGNGRIPPSSALFLFQCVHGERFSLDIWNAFMSSRPKHYEDVSYDEMKLWLCELPVERNLSESFEFDDEKGKLENERGEKCYQDWSLYEQLQADSSTLARLEANRNMESSLLKQKSKQRLRRLDKEGIDAILIEAHSHEDDYDHRKAREQVGASDVVALLKTKYETLREKLLLELIEYDAGEGIWLAMSKSDKEEKLLHAKMQERRLSQTYENKSRSHSSTIGKNYKRNLPALLGPSRINHEDELHEENRRKEILENEGKTDSEIHNIIVQEWQSKLLGEVNIHHMLNDLCSRYQSEKGTLKCKLRGERGGMTGLQRLQEYKFMYRQHLKASIEASYESACLAVAVSESSANGCEIDRFHFARHAQYLLADRHLSERRRGHRSPNDMKHGNLECHENAGSDVVDLYENLIKALERKHRAEMEIMISMLQGKEAVQNRTTVRKMTNEERANQRVVLKTQRKGWRTQNSEEKVSNRRINIQLLQEAVSIAYVEQHLEIKESGTNEDAVVKLLAQLLHQQELDADVILASEDQTCEEVLSVHRKQERMYHEEWLDNLSAVVLGTSDVTRLEVDIIKLLEEKYDCVRHKIIEESIKNQIGSNDWENTSLVERYNLVTRAKASEKQLRLQKRFDDALSLLGDGFTDGFTLISHLGENREAFMEKLKSVLERRNTSWQENFDVEDLSIDENGSFKISGNIWKDLDERFKNEKQLIITWLQEGGDSGTRDINNTTIRLKQHKRMTEQEPNMLCALLVLGLCERHRRTVNERLIQDERRRTSLAEERLISARLNGNRQVNEVEDIEPSQDASIDWMNAALIELERKQRLERQFLFSLLLDNALSDLRDEAREITEDERQQRSVELKNERDVLDLDEKGDQDMNHTILEMACAYKIESRLFRLKYTQKEGRITDDAIFVSIVADLLERHSDECEELMEKILDMSKDELKSARSNQIRAFRSEHMENVSVILLRYDGLGTNDEILQALEDKYDALKDKLLLEALRKQLGEDEWQRLSERERQHRLMKLKLETKRLKRENKLDELAKLLGDGFATDGNLRKLLGVNREVYEQRLRERLARRRERLAQGLPAEDDEEESKDMESKDGKSLFESLDERFEEERDALISKLLDSNNQFLSERERQALLARLKRERLKAKLEENFDSAALVLGLAERQRKEVEERMLSDRRRHEQLARQRLEERKNRVKRTTLSRENIIENGDNVLLQDAVIKFLENKHYEEREAMLNLLEYEDNDLENLAQSMTSEQRGDHLRQLKEKKESLNKDDTDEHRIILQEAAIMKQTSRRRTLYNQSTGEEILKQHVTVSLLADLQQEQDKECEILMASLPDKEKTELISLQTRFLAETESCILANIMTVFSAPEHVTNVDEQLLLDALDSKYETLRGKLLSEALVKEMGAAEWQALSEQERQTRLVQIKLEERRLRKEGKLDELQALLGNAIDVEAGFQDILGKNKVRHKKRLKEKLEKRRQRLKEGMSKEDIEKMEAEEDEQFENELKEEASVNPLIKLMQNHEKEREELIRALRNDDDRYASERHRQAQLVRLRREERKARHVDKFDTAALVLGLARAQKANLEEVQKKDRLRQEQLARERLAARREKKLGDTELRQKEDEKFEEIIDKDNIVALQEGVLKELEKKQECEREFLEKLLQQEETVELRKQTKEKSKENRNDRLKELKCLHEQWRDEGADGSAESIEEQNAILREAVCLNVTNIAEEMREGGKEVNDDNNVHVTILANLQQIQDQEAEILLRDLHEKSPTTLMQLRAVQHQARRNRWYDNIAMTFFGQKTAAHKHSGHNVPSEEELLNALEGKYDALKDKLIAQSLMNELGASVWERLSKKERQAEILKIRLQDKKLRKEGRFDEANRLFGEGLQHAASLSNLMGETKAQQKDALRRRLLKLRELKAAGIEMNTEEAQLLGDDIDAEAIEEEVTTVDMMQDLQSRYDDEKKALLASLRSQDERFGSERHRQLEMAKLRRQQMKISKEDKFDVAALVLGVARQQETARDASYRKDRARHEKLAKERLAALKAKTSNKENSFICSGEEEQRVAILTLLREQQERDKKILSQETLEIQNIFALDEAILKEVEDKHSIEIKMLIELLDVSESDADAVAAASCLTKKQRDEKLKDLYRSYKDWKISSIRASKNANSGQLSEEENDENILRSTERQIQLTALLKDGILLKALNVIDELSKKDIPESSVKDEMSILLLADLQEKQTTESRAVENILEEREEEVLIVIRDEQRRLRQEFVVDNLAAVILQNDQELLEENDDVSQTFDESDEQLAKMDAELEDERKRRLLTGASEAEVDVAMNELRRQQEAKRKMLSATLEHQRNLAKAKLAARRRRREDKQYEDDIATSLLMLVERESSIVKEKNMLQRSKQGESLRDRLARRREDRARRKAQEELERAAKENMKTTDNLEQEENHTPETASTNQVAKRLEKLNGDYQSSLPDGFTMKREKTVVDVKVSDDKKKEIFGSLLREHTTFGMGIERERKRQEDRLNERRLLKKSNVVAAAATIIGLGERQKTMVELKHKEERDRQLTMVRDRITRVRYERTMTMKEPKSTSKGFDHILTQEEAEGLGPEEKMKLIAAKMEEKFKVVERRVSSTIQSPPIIPLYSEIQEDEAADMNRRKSVRLDEKGKEKKLKERLAARKKAKRGDMSIKENGRLSETHMEDLENTSTV